MIAMGGYPLFKLEASENESAIDSSVLARYQHLVATDPYMDQPLARFVAAPSYQIFFSMLMPRSVPHQARLLQSDTIWHLNDSRVSASVKVAWLRHDTIQVVRFLATLRDGNPYVVHFITTDSAKARLAYQQDGVLLSRLQL